MSFFAKLKSVVAPKTDDADYEAARTTFKTFEVTSSPYESALRHLTRSLTELATNCQKCANDISAWVGTAAPTKTVSKLDQVTHFTDLFPAVTQETLALKIEPNFLTPFGQYEAAVSELGKLKRNRDDACKEYDKAREYLRLLEANKKSKKPDIDKAQAKATESQEKYERLNAEFKDKVTDFCEERRGTLGLAFRHMLAIICQYIHTIAPEGGEVTSDDHEASSGKEQPPEEKNPPAKEETKEEGDREKHSAEEEEGDKVQVKPTPEEEPPAVESPPEEEPPAPKQDTSGEPNAFGAVDGWGIDPFGESTDPPATGNATAPEVDPASPFD